MKKLLLLFPLIFLWATAYGGVIKTDINPKFQSIRLDSIGGGHVVIRAAYGSGDTVDLYLLPVDSCGVIFIGGAGSTHPDTLYYVTCTNRDTVNLLRDLTSSPGATDTAFYLATVRSDSEWIAYNRNLNAVIPSKDYISIGWSGYRFYQGLFSNKLYVPNIEVETLFTSSEAEKPFVVYPDTLRPDDSAAAVLGTLKFPLKRIHTDSIGPTNYTDNTIDAGDLATGSVASDEILNLSIAAGDIASGAVSPSKLDLTASYQMKDLTLTDWVNANDSVLTPKVVGTARVTTIRGWKQKPTGDTAIFRFDTAAGVQKWYGTDLSGNKTYLGAGGGEVTSTGTSSDNEIVRFDGATGDIIQGIVSNEPTISDVGLMTVPGGLNIGGADIESVERVASETTYVGGLYTYYVTKDPVSSNMIFKDATTGPWTLSQLASGGSGDSTRTLALERINSSRYKLSWPSVGVLQVADTLKDSVITLSAASGDTLVVAADKVGKFTNGAVDIYGMLRLSLNDVAGKYGFDTTQTPTDNYIWKFDAADSLFHLEADAGAAAGTGDTLIFNVSGTEYSIVSNRIKVKAGSNVTFTRADSTAYDVVTIASTGGSGTVVLPYPSYRFDDATSKADPGNGDIRFNSATPASVTHLYIDDATILGEDAIGLWNVVDTGYIVTIQGRQDLVADASQYRVTAKSDETGYWDLTVTVLGSGTLPALSDSLYLSIAARDVRTGTGETDTLANNGLWNGSTGYTLIFDSLGTKKILKGLKEGSGITITAEGDTALTFASTGGGLTMDQIRDTMASATGMDDHDILNVNRLDADSIGTFTASGTIDLRGQMRLFLDTGGGSYYVPFDTSETTVPAVGDVYSWDGSQFEIQAQTGGAGTGDTLIFNVSGTEYSIVSNRIKVKAGSNITFTRDDSTAYDVVNIASTGGGTGDQVVASGNQVDTLLLFGSSGVTATFNSDDDGGNQDSLTYSLDTTVTAFRKALEKAAFDDSITATTAKIATATLADSSKAVDTTRASLRALVIEHVDDSLDEYLLRSHLDDSITVTTAKIPTATLADSSKAVDTTRASLRAFVIEHVDDSLDEYLLRSHFDDSITATTAKIPTAVLADTARVISDGVDDYFTWTAATLVPRDSGDQIIGSAAKPLKNVNTNTINVSFKEGGTNTWYAFDTTASVTNEYVLAVNTSTNTIYPKLDANTGGGETDTTGIAGVPNGTTGFGMVSDSLGTRKTIRQLKAGTNVTLAYSGDTAVTIAASGSGSDNDTSKYLGDVGTGALQNYAYWSTRDTFTLADSTANKVIRIKAASDDTLYVEAAKIGTGNTVMSVYDGTNDSIIGDDARVRVQSIQVDTLFGISGGGDTIYDWSSASIIISGGQLQATLGTVIDTTELASGFTIGSRHIANDSILSADLKDGAAVAEPDLYAANAPSDNAILSIHTTPDPDSFYWQASLGTGNVLRTTAPEMTNAVLYGTVDIADNAINDSSIPADIVVSNYLPLAGGAMSSNADVTFSGGGDIYAVDSITGLSGSLKIDGDVDITVGSGAVQTLSVDSILVGRIDVDGILSDSTYAGVKTAESLAATRYYARDAAGDSAASIRNGDTYTGTHDFTGATTVNFATIGGAIDAGAATSLEIPNAATTGPTVEGQLTWDTGDNWLVTDDGTPLDVVIGGKVKTAQLQIDDPDNIIYDTVSVLFVNSEIYPAGIVILSCGVTRDDATRDSITFLEGTDLNSITSTIETIAGSTNEAIEDDGTLADATIAAGSYVLAHITDQECATKVVWITFYVPDN